MQVHCAFAFELNRCVLVRTADEGFFSQASSVARHVSHFWQCSLICCSCWSQTRFDSSISKVDVLDNFFSHPAGITTGSPTKMIPSCTVRLCLVWCNFHRYKLLFLWPSMKNSLFENLQSFVFCSCLLDLV